MNDSTQTSESPYNNWRNYQTWAIALWIDSYPERLEHWTKIALTHTYEETQKELQTFIKASMRLSPSISYSIHDDIVHNALSNVAWYSIYQHLRGD